MLNCPKCLVVFKRPEQVVIPSQARLHHPIQLHLPVKLGYQSQQVRLRFDKSSTVPKLGSTD
jgi:hypothetical protein